MKPAPQILMQEVEGEMVLLDPDKGDYYVLDDVGTRVWHLLHEHDDVTDVVRAMLEEFDVDEATVRSDVEALLAELKAAGLVRADPK